MQTPSSSLRTRNLAASIVDTGIAFRDRQPFRRAERLCRHVHPLGRTQNSGRDVEWLTIYGHPVYAMIIVLPLGCCRPSSSRDLDHRVIEDPTWRSPLLANDRWGA
jgi:hypothetical protein